MYPIQRPIINKDLQKMTFPFWGHYFGEGIFGSLAPFASACLAFKGKFHIPRVKNRTFIFFVWCEIKKVINESSTFGYLADRYNLSNMVSFSPLQCEIYVQFYKWSQFLFSAVMCFMSFGLAVTSLESDWYYLTQFHDNDKPGAQFMWSYKMTHLWRVPMLQIEIKMLVSPM